MKKKLFFFLSLVAMVFTMAAFTSCGDDDDNDNDDKTIVVNLVAVVKYDDNIDQATLAQIKEYEAALNQRLLKMFGKELKMKYDETIHNIPNDAREANANRIYDDSEFHSILEKLAKLTTTNGKYGAVEAVYVNYYSGTTLVYSWLIP